MHCPFAFQQTAVDPQNRRLGTNVVGDRRPEKHAGCARHAHERIGQQPAGQRLRRNYLHVMRLAKPQNPRGHVVATARIGIIHRNPPPSNAIKQKRRRAQARRRPLAQSLWLPNVLIRYIAPEYRHSSSAMYIRAYVSV